MTIWVRGVRSANAPGIDLSREEDAWCRRDGVLDSAAYLGRCLRKRKLEMNRSGNELGDEEDAWVRRWE